MNSLDKTSFNVDAMRCYGLNAMKLYLPLIHCQELASLRIAVNEEIKRHQTTNKDDFEKIATLNRLCHFLDLFKDVQTYDTRNLWGTAPEPPDPASLADAQDDFNREG